MVKELYSVQDYSTTKGKSGDHALLPERKVLSSSYIRSDVRVLTVRE